MKRPLGVLIIGSSLIAVALFAIMLSIPFDNVSEALLQGGVYSRGSKALVTYIDNNSTFYQLGFRNNDEIIEFNHQPVSSMSEYRRLADEITNADKSPDSVSITIMRNNQKLTFALPIQEITKQYHYDPNPREGNKICRSILTQFHTTEQKFTTLSKADTIIQQAIQSYLYTDQEIQTHTFCPIPPPSAFPGPPNPYAGHNRLHLLIGGIICALIGIGLLRLKKLALYIYLIYYSLLFPLVTSISFGILILVSKLGLDAESIWALRFLSSLFQEVYGFLIALFLYVYVFTLTHLNVGIISLIMIYATYLLLLPIVTGIYLFRKRKLLK